MRCVCLGEYGERLKLVMYKPKACGWQSCGKAGMIYTSY